MLRTLRSRLILSHILPAIVILPLLAFTLIYALESRILLPAISNDLLGHASLVARVASEHPDIWSNPQRAQEFAAETSVVIEAQVMLFDRQALLLASSDPGDATRVGQLSDIADWSRVQAGETVVHAAYSQSLQEEVADVVVPISLPNGHYAGAIRLSQRLASVLDQFVALRYTILLVLAGGLLLGATAGLVLARTLERPLRQVTQTVTRLASGGPLAPLPERGPREISQLLQAVNHLVERLQTMEESRRLLLANLVHELGRPLGALNAALGALARGADAEPALRGELLQGMQGEIGHLQRLLNDIAGLYDQTRGTLELDCRLTPMSTWLSHALVPWREAAQAKGLHWQATLPADLPALEIDPDRLAQALGNLLDNAIKFTPARGTISVDAGREEAAVWIRVGDTGPGIPPEEQERIFEPFYRSHPGRRFPQGMGLGLGIARSLVVAHGGQLELESTPGLGSRFTIRLPHGRAAS